MDLKQLQSCENGKFDWDKLMEAELKLLDGNVINAKFTKIYIEDAEPWSKELDDKLEEIEVSDFPSMDSEKTRYFFKTENIAEDNNNEIAKPKNETGKNEKFFIQTLNQYSFINDFNYNAAGKETLSPFEKVQYEIHDPIYCNKVVRKYYVLKETNDVNGNESKCERTILSKIKNGSNGNQPKKEDIGEPDNFDYSFDPERDAGLIAKNADKDIGSNPSLMRYWQQRYRLFSKINDGIIMDEQGWFSVTPEIIAKYTAARMIIPNKECTILDAFCGAGGNAIQFALAGAKVFVIDLDPVKLRCAKQNARVYGVEDQITFLYGDFFDVAKRFFEENSKNGKPLIDGIFLSPPWGGPEYYSASVFDLNFCCPNGLKIFDFCLKISQNIAYFLPKQTSAKQLMEIAAKTDSKQIEIEHNILNSKIRTLTAYYGDLPRKT